LNEDVHNTIIAPPHTRACDIKEQVERRDQFHRCNLLAQGRERCTSPVVKPELLALPTFGIAAIPVGMGLPLGDSVWNILHPAHSADRDTRCKRTCPDPCGKPIPSISMGCVTGPQAGRSKWYLSPLRHFRFQPTSQFHLQIIPHSQATNKNALSLISERLVQRWLGLIGCLRAKGGATEPLSHRGTKLHGRQNRNPHLLT